MRVSRMPSTRLLRVALILFLAAAASVHLAAPAMAAPALVWQRVIPGAVVQSSPAPVVLPDGTGGIVVGAHDGKVYTLNASDGTDAPGWPQQTTNAIDSSPAIAPTDGSGAPQIYIGSGVASAVQAGGLYSFDTAGHTRWHINASDNAGPSLSFAATPVIGDINRHNVADITAGDLGQTVLSVTANGVTNPGWPYLALDSTFSSGALADVNGDGQTDLVVGGDSNPGPQGTHPRGGIVRALTGSGGVLWEYRIDEQVISSPSIGDIDGDGRPDIVFGSGNYWANHGGSVTSRMVSAINIDGTPKPGWPRAIDGFAMASPTLADVNGDGQLDVVMGAWNTDGGSGSVYAWDGKTGNEIWAHHNVGNGTVIGQIVTADFNGDGAQDLLVPTSNGAYALDGKTGQQLFSVEPGLSMQNSPLIVDVTGKGQLSIIVAGENGSHQGVISRYDVPTTDKATFGALGWPMFRKDARRTGSWTNPPLVQNACVRPGGYWMAASDGGVFNFCDAGFYGSTGSIHLNQPIVAMAPTPTGKGYWMAASDGGIFNFGDAGFSGSTGSIHLNQPIVGMVPTPSGHGYWLVASDGGIFNFGDAAFLGSTGSIHLNQPIVGIARTPDGGGYWLVARDGGIFNFGNAPFLGSTGSIHLNQPIVAMATSGAGYWLTASDGGIFNFGTAPFLGSTGSIHLNQPIVGMSPTASGGGYWLVARDGGIFNYGDAAFLGSTGSIRLNKPMIGMAGAG
ncbi:MAG: hypothetical protein JWL57_2722 [Actinobacteria bacterium]|nr:hypothetical protein [Actinomycetota bacterium]